MSTTFNVITRIYWDIGDYLAADEKMQHVQVILERPRDNAAGTLLFENAVNNMLAGQVAVNGKAGLALLLFMPEGKPASRAHRGLVTDLEMIIRAVEEKSINDAPDTGTGIPCEDLLLETMLLLQTWTPLRGHPLQVSEFYPVPLKDQPNIRAWECVVTTSDAQTAREKCSLPHISAAGYIVTLTTATADAALYYSTDGTLPTPTTGTLYTAPVDLEGPLTLRVMAWKTGFMPSDCVNLDL